MLLEADLDLANELRLLGEVRAALDYAETALSLPLDPARLSSWAGDLAKIVGEMKRAGLFGMLPQRQTADLLGSLAAHALSLRWSADALIIDRRASVPLSTQGTDERIRTIRRTVITHLIEARKAFARWERCAEAQPRRSPR